MTNCNPCNKLKEYDPCDCITKQLVDECSGKTINYVTLASAVLMACGGKETIEDEIKKIYLKIAELGDITVSEEHFIQMLLAVKHHLLDILYSDIQNMIEDIMENLLANKFLNLLEFFILLFNDWNELLLRIIESISHNVTYEQLEIELARYINHVEYSSLDKKIYFYHDSTIISEVDTTDFVKDGIIQSVTIGEGSGANTGIQCLIITFAIDGGTETVEIPLGNLFDPNNYYTKSEIDSKGYLTDETDPTVPRWVKAITATDINRWNNKLDKISDLSEIRRKAYSAVLDVCSGLTNESLVNNNKIAKIPCYSLITACFAPKDKLSEINDVYNIRINATDITGDGIWDIADVNAIINVMLNRNVPGDYANGGLIDLTGNGNIGIEDVNAVINIMLGKQPAPNEWHTAYDANDDTNNNPIALVEGNIYYNILAKKLFLITEVDNTNNCFKLKYLNVRDLDESDIGYIEMLGVVISDGLSEASTNARSLGNYQQWTNLINSGKDTITVLIAGHEVAFPNAVVEGNKITASITAMLDEFDLIMFKEDGTLEDDPNAGGVEYTLTYDFYKSGSALVRRSNI